MSRKLRIQYPGAIYHIMNRGDRSENIFRDDQDRQCFLSTLQECCKKTACQIHSYCLMSNHFHLVAETPDPNVFVTAATLASSTVTNNSFRFTVSEVSGLNYIVQANTNLSTTNWIAIATNTAPFTITDTALTNNPQRFYRALYKP